MATTWVVAAVAALVALLVLVRAVRHRRPRNAPRVVAGGRVPVLGALVGFAKHPIKFVESLYRKHGAVFSVRVFGNTMTYLIGPEAQTAFFKATDEELSPSEAYKFMVPVFGKGVVYDAPISVMKEQFKMVRGGLSAERLKTYVSKMVAECEEYFARFGNEGSLDLTNTFAELVILTASNCLLGDEIRKHMGKQVADLYRVFDEGLNAVAFFAPNLPLPAFRRRNAARAEMYKRFLTVIHARRASTQRHEDMLQTLMEAHYRDGTPLPDEHICGMLLGLLFAGQHTSSITSAWTGLLLLNHPDYLARVMEEQHQVRAKYADRLTFEALQEMTLLENAVLETLRMYPPLIFLMRKVKKPVPVGDLVIPVGDLAVISPAIGHRLETVYANPDKWDPDRFARGEHKEQTYGWFGFGGGMHGCIGEKFGLLQVKTIWSTLLKEFDWAPHPKVPLPDYHSMVVGPTPPAIMSFRRRGSHSAL